MQIIFWIKQIRLAWLPCLLLITLALIIQKHVFIHADNIYLLHASQLLLSGGSYSKNFFEPNPPLIMLLYAPVIGLMKYTILSLFNAFYLYITCLGCVSLFLSYRLLQGIFTNDKMIYVTLYVSTIVIFVIPDVSFGQRENLLVMFTLPYLWSALARLEDKAIPFYLSMMVGILAGIGFSLKPNFIFVPMMVESYFVIYKKNVFGWVRIESVSILLVGLSYLAMIFVCFPDYIHVMVPLLARYFHRQHWYVMLIDPIPFYVVMVVSLSFWVFKKHSDSIVMRIFVLATIGMLISYLLSGAMEFFHVLPAFSLAIMLGYLCVWRLMMDVYKRELSLATLTLQWLIWLSLALIFGFVMMPGNVVFPTALMASMNLCLVFLSLVSIALTYKSLQAIVQNELLEFITITVLITFTFVFVAMSRFGQHGQLQMIFILPYFFGLMQRLKNQSRKSGQLCLSGMLLGFAFMIDYYLLVVVFMLEVYVMFQQKKILWSLEREIIIAVTLCLFFYWGLVDFIAQQMGVNIRYVKLYYYYNVFTHYSPGGARGELSNLYGLSISALIVANVLIALIAGGFQLNKRGLASWLPIFIQLQKISICLLAVYTVFSYPIRLVSVGTVSSIQDKRNGLSAPMFSFFNKSPGSTYSFIGRDDSPVMLEGYTGARFVGQFPMYWWLNGMNAILAKPMDKALYSQILNDADFLVNKVAQDIQVNKPQYVIVALQKMMACKFVIKKRRTDHCDFVLQSEAADIKQFLAYPTFREAWRHYVFLKKMDDYEIYQRNE